MTSKGKRFVLPISLISDNLKDGIHMITGSPLRLEKLENEPFHNLAAKAGKS